MTPELDKGLIPYFVGGLVSLIGILFGWVQQRKHSQVDESALVLNKWKEFAEIHQADMKQLKAEFAQYKNEAIAEIATLRIRLNEVEAAFAKYRLEAAEHIASRDVEIAGLKRAIAQNSQSAAYQIGQTNRRAAKAGAKADETESRIDSLTNDKNAAHSEIHDEIEECVQRLDRIGDNSIQKEGE